MSMRVVRHMAGRSINADDAKVSLVVPFFPGESPEWCRLSWYVATRADSYADQPNEVNMKVLSVPWSLALTYASWDNNSQAGYAPFQNAAAFDTLYRELVFDAANDGNEYYGGESSATGQTAEDEIKQIGDGASGSTATGVTDDEPIISYGPSRLRSLFSREILMGVATAEGDNKVRWSDFGNTHIQIGGGGFGDGGLLLFGFHRYEHSAETNYGVELNQGDVANGLAQFLQGDLSLIQQRINTDTSDAADWIRTTLFGGDNYIEADTLKGDPAKGYMKAQIGFSTPYKRISAF